jgi:hypothetical protein
VIFWTCIRHGAAIAAFCKAELLAGVAGAGSVGGFLLGRGGDRVKETFVLWRSEVEERDQVGWRRRARHAARRVACVLPHKVHLLSAISFRDESFGVPQGAELGVEPRTQSAFDGCPLNDADLRESQALQVGRILDVQQAPLGHHLSRLLTFLPPAKLVRVRPHRILSRQADQELVVFHDVGADEGSWTDGAHAEPSSCVAGETLAKWVQVADEDDVVLLDHIEWEPEHSADESPQETRRKFDSLWILLDGAEQDFQHLESVLVEVVALSQGDVLGQVDGVLPHDGDHSLVRTLRGLCSIGSLEN